ncbi:MAG: EthD domain-containing protein [Porticoccaceae bacterium]|nr:EthD domain-containing protein [Pseudomonadales bacterium]MCP5171078.1 EthD domain-containing protein [Pseudomonadales bacterium]MCP5301683.1 EthD domain-containing protein [Pseudomonadales bacterium]
MIKMVVDVWKKPEMTDEQFKRRWLVEHGTLVKEHARAMGFVKYIQSHKIPSPEIEAFAAERGWQRPADGLTEVWWESMDAMQAAMSSSEGQKASAILQQDEEQFIDVKKISAYLAEEKVIFDYQNQ